MPTDKGDIVIFPAPTEANRENHRVTIHWQQSLKSRSADYIVVVATNKTKGGNAVVPFFIQSEWYTDGYLPGAGTRTEDGNFEISVDARFQFGEKNVGGEKRFFVWQDKERKQWQHIFLETAMRSLPADVVTKLAGAFGQTPAADIANTIVQGFVVDYFLNV